MGSTFFEAIGFIAASISMISNVPQLVLFYRQGHAKGISILGNWVGFVAVLLRTIYLFHTTHGDLLSMGPYYFGLFCILFTKYYIYFPSKQE